MTDFTSNAQACAALEAVLPQLGDGDRAFAQGLLQSTKQYGLTDGRRKWIAELISRAGKPAQPAQQVKVGDFHGVYALFAKAMEHLQWPKIRLQLRDGSPVVLAVAGPNSKHKGEINVTDGAHYPSNKWYGRVTPDGVWTKSSKVFQEAPEVEFILQRLAEHPAETASEYGRLTGRCCFCNRALQDEQSTAAGYGPICAANFGLTAARKAAVPVFDAAMGVQQ